MTDRRALLDDLRAAVRDRRSPSPATRIALTEIDDPVLLRKAGRVLTGLAPTDAELRPVRVTVLATCTIGAFEHLLQAALTGAGLLPTIEPADYGSFDLTLASAAFAGDPGGSGAPGEPDLVACLMDETYFLPADWTAVDVAATGEHVRRRLAEFEDLVASSLQRTSATVVLHTIPLPAEVLDTHIGWRARAAAAAMWHELNAGLLHLAERHRQVVVVDLVTALAARSFPARDHRLHRYADLPYTDGALLVLAGELRRVAQAMAGLSRKVLALDLDNTLWGGVLGEVGAGGVQLGGLYPGNCYSQLQRTVRRLREQGVVLVLASKNDAALVTQALTDHPEVLLRPEAFSVTAVNWSSKAENLRRAAESLGLATQSFVFMDDSAFERGHVADELPEIALVAADADPAYLESALLRSGWFDVVDVTDTDLLRPQLYRSRAMREEFSTGFGSSEDYLRALRIEVVAEPVTAFTVARVAQLAARTNQFNLTGRRFDEAATAAMSTDPGFLVASFSASDRFGDEGIVGALWVERGAEVWRVLNLVLSCRVLGRGVELAMADWLVARARAAGAGIVEGRFVATRRNGVAGGFWERAGFTPTGTDGVFALDISTASDRAPEWIRVLEGSGV